MRPKISVIIPIYNVEKYLRRCLDSVKNQTFTDWQAICVDDGSPDKSGQIAEEYAAKDKRFVVVHKNNTGVSDTRNVGIKYATGQYIHFMDSDDEIDKDYYEKLLAGGEDADIIGSGFVSNSKYSPNLVYGKKRALYTLFGKLFWTQALSRSFVWRYLFKTDFIKKNKLLFDTSLISQEDAVFLLQALALSKKIVLVPNVNYYYIFNPNSALNNKKNHDALKRQYKLSKVFRKQYAKQNHVSVLWNFRKLIRLFF